GGDVHKPRDAILGAANYLHASGAPPDYRRARPVRVQPLQALRRRDPALRGADPPRPPRVLRVLRVAGVRADALRRTATHRAGATALVVVSGRRDREDGEREEDGDRRRRW